MNKNYTLIKNIQPPVESTIFGMDIVSPVVTLATRPIQSHVVIEKHKLMLDKT